MDTPELDEEAVLNCFRKTAQAAKGCKLEIAQRDVYMIGNSPEKVRRYVELARKGLEGYSFQTELSACGKLRFSFPEQISK